MKTTKCERSHVFERWLSEYRALIFRVVHSSASAFQDRNDLFQEIALQLWKSIPYFRGESKESTWIFKVALNTTARWHRRESRHGTNLEYRPESDMPLLEEQPVPDEQLQWLYKEIRALDPVNRSLILLALEGYSYREIAEVIGITENHVGVKLARLKQQLSRNAEEAKHEL